ncbi:MAG: helix-turn-helix domain-containing protein [Actinomycetota bacterium]|nr:helix-turn-helix domain-containing protein [Actinomycetota bacterium]
MSDSLTINPGRLSDDDWAVIRAFVETANREGSAVKLQTREVYLTPAQVAKRLSMSRSTVLRRIASGDLKAVKVGTHHKVSFTDFKRFSDEILRRMAEATAPDIEVELFSD